MSEGNVLARFPAPPGEGRPLADLCRELYRGQLLTWREFAEAYAALQAVWIRELQAGGERFVVQFNPGREASTAADLDPAALAARACFLCPDRLPREQAAVLYREEYLILCNPRPIFSPHFTVSARAHRPQDLAGGIEDLLALAKDLAPDLNVFYNGPDCGASAPDHLHFQVYPRGGLPVDRRLAEAAKDMGAFSLACLSLAGREAVVLAGTEAGDLAGGVRALLAALGRVRGGEGEGMVNCLGGYYGRGWVLAVFPRRRGRPGAYYLAGEGRRVISPGSVEMGGMVITVHEGDFAALDEGTLLGIYEDVALEAPLVREAAAAVRGVLRGA